MRLDTDEVVERIAVSGDTDPKDFAARVVALASKYDVPVSAISHPVPLEKCTVCPCGGYVDRVVTSADLRAQSRSN